MSDYSRDLHFDVILPRRKIVSYKQVLMIFAGEAAKHLDIARTRVFELLSEQETRGSSGVGAGVAIAHLQMRGPQRPLSVLATLARPVDVRAADNQPADLACLVLSPASDGPRHLRRLSRISRLLLNAALHRKLCEARDEQAIRALLIDPEGWLAAA